MFRTRPLIALTVTTAALLTASALIAPVASASAQDWNNVRTDNSPMVTGSGRVVRQSRAVPAFRSVETTGSEQVVIRFGPRAAVEIAADDNILPLITTEVRGGTLKIGSRGSYRLRGPVRVWLTVPDLASYQSVGSGNAVIEGVNNDRLALTLTGSGDIRATGRTRELTLALNGSGRAELAGLVADRVHVDLRGSGDATVRPGRQLNAQLFGSGTIRYLGNPPQIDRQRFGSGRIVAVR